ncbi:hypothetical protein FKM82_002607 [Ascaphus truei]
MKTRICKKFSSSKVHARAKTSMQGSLTSSVLESFATCGLPFRTEVIKQARVAFEICRGEVSWQDGYKACIA